MTGFRNPAWPDARRAHEASVFGLWVFIASEAMLFGAAILVYAVLRGLHPEAWAAASAELSAPLGTLNTAILLTSSFAIALAARRAEVGDHRRARLALTVTAALGLCFLGVKGYEWWDEAQNGLIPALGLDFAYDGPHREGVQLFFNVYLALTGIHAVHLVSAVSLVLWRVAAWGAPTRRRDTSVEGLALYWHFVDLVWVFLYPLLYLIAP